MKKCFTLLLLILMFAGCSEEEEQKPAAPYAGTNKAIIDRRQSEVGSRQSAVGSPIAADHSRKHTIRKRQPADFLLKVADQPRRIDTTFIQKLIRFQSPESEIDLREPVSREYLVSSVDNPDFESMILLSHERSIKINFDNDIFDNTDRYFTNGIRFDFISPVMRQSPLSYLMVPYWGHGINYYGISICQNMYTPSTTKLGGILYGDRPYAASLFIEGFKITNDRKKKFRQTTGIDLGVIGPSSYGDFVQKSFHNSVPTNNEPLGWENQIQDDLVLNYNLSYEKGIFGSRHLELNLNATGALGTLYTNAGGGFLLRAGRMNPYFDSYGFSRMMVDKARGYSRFQVFGFLTSTVKLVGYDATLQGGMFNKSSVYTLPAGEISSVTYQASLGLTLAYAGFRFDLEQFVLSPEFHGCSWHKWVHLGVTFGM
jgi:lipid A 3-O-deacylase